MRADQGDSREMKLALEAATRRTRNASPWDQALSGGGSGVPSGGGGMSGPDGAVELGKRAQTFTYRERLRLHGPVRLPDRMRARTKTSKPTGRPKNMAREAVSYFDCKSTEPAASGTPSHASAWYFAFGTHFQSKVRAADAGPSISLSLVGAFGAGGVVRWASIGLIPKPIFSCPEGPYSIEVVKSTRRIMATSLFRSISSWPRMFERSFSAPMIPVMSALRLSLAACSSGGLGADDGHCGSAAAASAADRN